MVYLILCVYEGMKFISYIIHLLILIQNENKIVKS